MLVVRYLEVGILGRLYVEVLSNGVVKKGASIVDDQ